MNKNGTALGGSCSPPPEPARKTQGQTFMSETNYNTASTAVKTVNQPSAETRALWLLRELGYKNIQQLDWIGEKEQWDVFEIKDKELFEPGPNFPYWGAGLNKSQLHLRTQLLEKLGWRTYLIIFVKGTNEVYGAYLDELEKGKFYDTKNGIRIYPIDNFKAIHDAPNQNLGGSG